MNLNNNVTLLNLINTTTDVITTVNNEVSSILYKQSNVIKHGSDLLDQAGVISNFSETDYGMLPSDISLSDVDSWELGIVANFNDLPKGKEKGCILFGYPEFGVNRYKCPQIAIGATNNEIRLCISSTTNNSWDVVNDVSLPNYYLQTNINYLFVLSYKNNNYCLKVYNNDSNVLFDEISVDSDKKAYGFYNASVGMGGGTVALQPIFGSVDLNKCYLDINNERFWTGTTSVSSNNLANIDLDNLSNNGKKLISKLSSPSITYDDLELGTSGTNYTAPANGWFVIEKRCSTSTFTGSRYIYVNNHTSHISQERNGTYYTNNLSVIMPAKKGDIVSVGYDASGKTELFRFVYAEGNK